MSERPQTPQEAWKALRDGNERFVDGQVRHPNQDAARRADLATGQRPFATFFGCSDSRVAAEVIFDQGLGDLFVVRTAGHVVGPTELGSMEFGTDVLGIPLIVVLGHDSCGAVGAAMDAVDTGDMPGGFLRDLVERVMPSVIAAKRHGVDDRDGVMAEHVRQAARLILERSKSCADAVDEGRLAVVGLTYTLADGRASLVEILGDIGETLEEADDLGVTKDA
ncbi:MAG: carbonic anhydrase [Mobilicoccus sp.]|nr:carbonic anhydrase [Mobilicoccus sp.]